MAERRKPQIKMKHKQVSIGKQLESIKKQMEEKLDDGIWVWVKHEQLDDLEVICCDILAEIKKMRSKQMGN